MTEPCMLSLSEMAAQIQERRLSPLSLMESALRRIDALEPKIQAWVTLDREKALAEARQCQEEIGRNSLRGPLHGIPIGVKDIFYTAGVKTTAGSRIFRDFTPSYDAAAVARLKKAGAIILGKTATTEFAAMDPAPTRNPWNLDHTPGGSSSGSAAAVAARMCPAALGSQTGGSVLRPAAYCGVVGLKPTYGRISRHGVFALSWSLDHVGFLTRSVEDAARILGVLAGPDPADPTSRSIVVPDYVQGIRSFANPPRIGLVRTFYQEKSEEKVWSHTEEILKKLESAGLQIGEVKMPDCFSVAHDAHTTVFRSETASFHEKLFAQHADHYGPKLRQMIEVGLLIPAVEYLHARKIQRQFRREMEAAMQPFDCLLTPSVSAAAPQGLSSTGNAWFQAPWSFSGQPAITIPTGLNEKGLPLGIQLVGKAFQEERLLAAAWWCERSLRVSLAP